MLQLQKPPDEAVKGWVTIPAWVRIPPESFLGQISANIFIPAYLIGHMPSYRVDYNHSQDQWEITKNGNHVSYHRKKSTAKRRAKELAKKAADRGDHATVQVSNRTKPGQDLFEYGSRGGQTFL